LYLLSVRVNERQRSVVSLAVRTSERVGDSTTAGKTRGKSPKRHQ
jgi:hypothetical protein